MSIRRAVFKRWPVLLFSLVVLVVAWWWVSTYSAIGRLRASGAPTTYEELVAEPIPDEENVAAGLRDLQPRLTPTEELVADTIDALEAGSAANLDQARQVLADQAETLAAVHQTIDRPRYASLFEADQFADFEALTSALRNSKAATRLLRLEGLVALADGQTDRAADVAIAMARLGKHCEQEPLVIYRQVANAVQTTTLDLAERVAQAESLSGENAQRLDEALASLEDRSGLAQALITERALTLEKLREMPFYVRMWQQRSLLELYEQVIEAAETRDTPPDAANAPTLIVKQSLSLSLVPTIQSLWESEKHLVEETRRIRELLAEGDQ